MGFSAWPEAVPVDTTGTEDRSAALAGYAVDAVLAAGGRGWPEGHVSGQVAGGTMGW